jgi:hypothetical protein
MQKIEDVESYLEQIFSKSCSSEFPGYRIRVSLLDKNQRKKRKDASAWYWTPEAGGQILVSFEPEPQAIPVGSASAVPPAAAPPKTDPTPPRTSTALSDLIRALNEAELRPGYGFIALKWFRDQVLPAVRPEWSAPDARSAILRDAIERGLVLTSKVPNPKSPAFPVTAVRLNRSAPQVAEALGAAAPAPDEFRPIPIRGESLSKTILRERR